MTTSIILTTLWVWNIIPMLIVAFLPTVPWHEKIEAIMSFVSSAVRGLLSLPAILLSPIAVTIALLFTKRNDDHLPALFRWWDNDVSINGDLPEYWPIEYTGPTYYSDSEPRSYKARWIWLVVRNRASWLSQKLGMPISVGDDRQSWGDVLTERGHPGWTLRRAADAYQLYIVKSLFGKWELRINYGFKVGQYSVPTAVQANVVNITASVLQSD